MASNKETLTSVEENTHRQRRWGCTCGCLSFLLALTLTTLAFTYFALKPYPLASPARWLRPQTRGFGVLRLSTADTGFADLFSFLANQVEEKVGKTLNENERRALRSAMLLARQSPDWIFYPPIYVYIENEEKSSELKFVLIGQFRHFFGYLLCRSFIQSLEIRPTQENAYLSLYRFGAKKDKETIDLALAPQNLLVSNSEALIKFVAGQEDKTSPMSPSERFMTYYGELHTDRPEPGEDLAFILTNENNIISSFFETLFASLQQKQVWERIRETLAKHSVDPADFLALKVSCDLKSSDHVVCTSTFYFERPDALQRFADAAKLLEGLGVTPQAKQAGIAIKIESRKGRDSVTITVDVTGLRRIISEIDYSHSSQRALGTQGASTDEVTSGL